MRPTKQEHLSKDYSKFYNVKRFGIDPASIKPIYVERSAMIETDKGLFYPGELKDRNIPTPKEIAKETKRIRERNGRRRRVDLKKVIGSKGSSFYISVSKAEESQRGTDLS